ncbi:hypothetical protein J1N35_035109 [Gossypium stocksii]|uniref:Uncharacterized protein n=1 Tax=Gossypium stocksii TaxID=47602 RepID=A0A9D3UU51_9ROSI|nr:hypothetical protein J1N35_035109 [Gossypium stocksii]
MPLVSLTSWDRPTGQWTKCNVDDGAIYLKSNVVSFDEVLQDSNGQIVNKIVQLFTQVALCYLIACVMDEQEHERIHVNTNELENQDPPVRSITPAAERRGIREKRPPKVLTDFVLLGQPVQSILVQERSSDTRGIWGKGKLKDALDNGFLFSLKPVSVELPLFTGHDLEEWIALAQDFFDYYNTVDHHRVTMVHFT